MSVCGSNHFIDCFLDGRDTVHVVHISERSIWLTPKDLSRNNLTVWERIARTSLIARV